MNKFKLNPNTQSIALGIIIAVLSLCGLALLLDFLYTIRTVFVYIMLAAVIALMGRPLMILLTRKLKFSSTLAASFTILIFVCLIAGFFYIMVPLLIKQTEVVSSLNPQEIQLAIEQQISELNKLLLQYDIHWLNEYSTAGWASLLDIQGLSKWFSGLLGFLSEFSIGSFAVLFISFFFLKERNLFNNMLLAPFPDEYEGRIANSVSKIKNLLSRYFIGLVLQVMVMFVLYYSVLFFLVDVEGDSALLIALICALCNIIPYLGPLLGFVFIVLLSMSNLYSQGLNFSQEIVPSLYWLIGGYIFIQAIDNFVNQPLIYSRSVKSHPLEIFLVIIIGGLLAGVIGVVLAVPFYTVIRVILKEFFFEFKLVKSITKNI